MCFVSVAFSRIRSDFTAFKLRGQKIQKIKVRTFQLFSLSLSLRETLPISLSLLFFEALPSLAFLSS